ncbi:hypothetical protein V6N12_000367 [Hibiscus sabdariffa]|uniref:Uncharacterized protein n=1 Tax=Hibiscus sabdariffa TaxID=183260 RepID=A0ABR2BI05_9ROSI
MDRGFISAQLCKSISDFILVSREPFNGFTAPSKLALTQPLLGGSNVIVGVVLLYFCVDAQCRSCPLHVD